MLSEKSVSASMSLPRSAIHPANAMRNGPWNIDLNKLPEENPSETFMMEESWDMEMLLIDAIRSYGCSGKTVGIDGVKIPVGESVVRDTRDNDNREEDECHVSKRLCRGEERDRPHAPGRFEAAGGHCLYPFNVGNNNRYVVLEKGEYSKAPQSKVGKSIVWFSKYLHGSETPINRSKEGGVSWKRAMEADQTMSASAAQPLSKEVTASTEVASKKVGKKQKKYRTIESLYQSTKRME